MLYIVMNIEYDPLSTRRRQSLCTRCTKIHKSETNVRIKALVTTIKSSLVTTTSSRETVDVSSKPNVMRFSPRYWCLSICAPNKQNITIVTDCITKTVPICSLFLNFDSEFGINFLLNFLTSCMGCFR
jgi:hypothetical protein